MKNIQIQKTNIRGAFGIIPEIVKASYGAVMLNEEETVYCCPINLNNTWTLLSLLVLGMTLNCPVGLATLNSR